MDTQHKRGILEICVLAVLAGGVSYGYQIVADLAQVIELSESIGNIEFEAWSGSFLYPCESEFHGNGCQSGLGFGFHVYPTRRRLAASAECPG